MRLVLFSFLLVMFACGPADKKTAKMYPSDYMYAQRSYPSGEIDKKAYRAAVEERKSYQRSTRSFDEPWNSEGPTNVCGRLVDIEMPYDDTNTIYISAASGGIFKSVDQGQNWEPIFQDYETLSIGDMAIHKQNSQVMYVGTGEANAGGGSLAYDGNGVYYSEDAGASWTQKGLQDVGSIGKVVIDPQDSKKVFVAGMGTLFANNSERGVYRTEDGGDSWEQVLFLSDSTGAIDLAIHPTDGNIVYAAMWERKRRPHDRSYGGETSGIYKSTDGGDTWNELTDGLPTNPDLKGRIGIAISESHPDILYAYYAMPNGPISGVFKSEDGGETWTAKSIAGITNVPYIWWFGKIFVNPTDPDDIYVTSLTMHQSQDGGDSWAEVFENAHADHHAHFIHPLQPDLILNGNDGGIYKHDSGGSPAVGEYLTGYSNFQFYTCEINPHDPSILLGGSQDNGTMISEGTADSWRRIYFGDGFRVLVDPDDENRIYAEYQYGNIAVSDDGGQNFQPATIGLTGDANWNGPIAIDPNDSKVLYTGRQRLFRTTNGANSWSAISQSLVNADNPSGVITFGSVTTIDVSSHDSSVVYAGTDDGNVWVTKDNGFTFENISANLPQRWVTAVTHDPWIESGVYVTVSGFRFGESSAQVFYSDDYGSSWRAIGESLPDVPVNDIVADDLINGKVYIATDIGVFHGENRGDWWTILGTDMPIVPVTDVDLDSASRTLAAATYGKGMYTYVLPSEPSSTLALNEDIIKIYPNPTTSGIEILGEIVNESYTLINVKGQVVQSGPVEGKISIEELEAGNYFLKVGNRAPIKIVKQ